MINALVSPTIAQQRESIAGLNWFHAINFGNGLNTPGRFSDQPPNWTLYGVFYFLEKIKTEGLRCLDIGTFDGLVAFILKALGAKYVLGTDLLDLQTFRLARQILNADVDYMPRTSISDLPSRLLACGGEQYDIAVISGVLYHLYDPLIGLAICRKLLKRYGILVVETEVREGPEAVLHLNSSYDRYLEPYTYWLPTPKAVWDMPKFCCFEPIAAARASHRCTFLARAVRPSEISQPTASLRLIHSKQRALVPEYLDFGYIQTENEPPSPVSYSGVPEEVEINIDTFRTALPLQP